MGRVRLSRNISDFPSKTRKWVPLNLANFDYWAQFPIQKNTIYWMVIFSFVMYSQGVNSAVEKIKMKRW
jgi:hypothetical protein